MEPCSRKGQEKSKIRTLTMCELKLRKHALISSSEAITPLQWGSFYSLTSRRSEKKMSKESNYVRLIRNTLEEIINGTLVLSVKIFFFFGNGSGRVCALGGARYRELSITRDSAEGVVRTRILGLGWLFEPHGVTSSRAEQ